MWIKTYIYYIRTINSWIIKNNSNIDITCKEADAICPD